MWQCWNITSWNCISLWIFIRATVCMLDIKCFCCRRDYYGCVLGMKRSTWGVMVEMLRRGVYLVLRGRSAWRGFGVANGSVSILLECTDSALLELLVCLCTRREFSRRWGLRRRNMSLECLGETVYLVAHFFLLDRKRGRAQHYFSSCGGLAWRAWIDSSYATSPVFSCVLWCCPRC